MEEALARWLQANRIAITPQEIVGAARRLMGGEMPGRFVAHPHCFWLCDYTKRHLSCYVYPDGAGVRLVVYVGYRRHELRIHP